MTTNVLGTSHVIAAAEEFGAERVVFASTGKALRPYSREVYTASKRAGEWLMACAAGRGKAGYAAARFTHVVDNSIIYSRLLGWCQVGVIRLHAADIMFYAQSALESAQLLLCAGLDAGGRGTGGPGPRAPGTRELHTRGQDARGQDARGGRLWVRAITDLGWPVGLLDLALGVLARAGSETPIYFSGYDPGYESVPFAGLYDPRTAGEVSPLLNGFEAGCAEQVPGRVTDEFPARFEAGPASDAQLLALQEACETSQPAVVRAALDALSWRLLDANLKAAPRETLIRAAALSAPFEDELSSAHRRILAAVRQHAEAI